MSKMFAVRLFDYRVTQNSFTLIIIKKKLSIVYDTIQF